jgi:DNA cross-link repair 1B protein
MLQQKFEFSDEKLVVLEYNECTTLYVESVNGPQHKFTVTAFDAHHCPGAAMFLFEGDFGTILYTGDFRYEVGINGCYEELSFMGCQKSIDLLYLDNTYCDSVCEHPPRHAVTEAIIDRIKEFFTTSPNGSVYIGMDSLGKECLAVRIAQEMKMWIGVDQERMERLILLGLPNVFTTDLDQVRISIISNRIISDRKIAHWTEEGACLVILPTSRYCGPGGVSFKFTSDNVAVYQYSDHSSFSELHHFVKAVSPKKIAPIVQFKGVSASRNNMDVFKPYLNSEPLNPLLDKTASKIVPNKSYLLDAPSHDVPRVNKKRQPSNSANAGKLKKAKGVEYASPHKLRRRMIGGGEKEDGKQDFTQDKMIYVEPVNAWDIGSGPECVYTSTSVSHTDTDDPEGYVSAQDVFPSSDANTHIPTATNAGKDTPASRESLQTPQRGEGICPTVPEGKQMPSSEMSENDSSDFEIPLQLSNSGNRSKTRKLPKSVLSLISSESVPSQDCAMDDRPGSGNVDGSQNLSTPRRGGTHCQSSSHSSLLCRRSLYSSPEFASPSCHQHPDNSTVPVCNTPSDVSTAASLSRSPNVSTNVVPQSTVAVVSMGTPGKMAVDTTCNTSASPVCEKNQGSSLTEQVIHSTGPQILQQVDSPLQEVDSPLQQIDSPLQRVDSPLQHEDSPLQQLDSPLKSIYNLLEHVDNPSQQVDNPLQQVDSPLQQVDSPLQQVDSPLQQVDSPLQQVDSSLQQVDSQLQQVNSPLQQVDSPLQQVNSPLQQVDSPLQQVDSSLQQVDSQLQQVNSPLQQVDSPLQQFNRKRGLSQKDVEVQVNLDEGASCGAVKRPLSLLQQTLSPLQTSSSPAHALTSPVHALTSPVHALTSPVHALTSPVHALTSPVHALTSPVCRAVYVSDVNVSSSLIVSTSSVNMSTLSVNMSQCTGLPLPPPLLTVTSQLQVSAKEPHMMSHSQRVHAIEASSEPHIAESATLPVLASSVQPVQLPKTFVQKSTTPVRMTTTIVQMSKTPVQLSTTPTRSSPIQLVQTSVATPEQVPAQRVLFPPVSNLSVKSLKAPSSIIHGSSPVDHLAVSHNTADGLAVPHHPEDCLAVSRGTIDRLAVSHSPTDCRAVSHSSADCLAVSHSPADRLANSNWPNRSGDSPVVMKMLQDVSFVHFARIATLCGYMYMHNK